MSYNNTNFYNNFIFENISEFQKRYNKRVIRYTEGCWGWKGGLSSVYPIICYKYSIGAHRVSWTITNGRIPDGLFILHLCDNTICTRPDHLKVGTHKENMSHKALTNKPEFIKNQKSKVIRLSISVDPQMIKIIKYRAIENNSTIKEWVLTAIADKIKTEDDLKGNNE